MTPGFSGAKAASMRQVSIRFQISVQDWPPTQITLAVVRKTGRAYGYLNGALAMGKVYSLDSKQEHLDGSPLECDEITYEEHTDDVVSLLEENARLRKLVFRLSEIVLRNAVDGEWEPAAEL
jgi:hypothetical protein